VTSCPGPSLVDEPQYRSAPKLTELTSRHFQARSSVSTLQEFTCSFLGNPALHRRRLAGGSSSAWKDTCGKTSPAKPARPPTASVRREATRKGHNAIIFIHEDVAADQREYGHLLALRLVAILRECDIPCTSAVQRNASFWHGSLNEWRELLQKSTGGTHSLLLRSAVTHQAKKLCPGNRNNGDLRPLCGNRDLAGQITDMAEAF